MIYNIISALYIYHKDTGNLDQFFALYYEAGKHKRHTIPGKHWGIDKSETAFATDGVRLRMLIASKPGVVFENNELSTISVWFNELDLDKAIDLFSEYILNEIGPEIRAHKSFRDRVNADYNRYLSSRTRIRY